MLPPRDSHRSIGDSGSSGVAKLDHKDQILMGIICSIADAVLVRIL
jgi:hypothetical protein